MEYYGRQHHGGPAFDLCVSHQGKEGGKRWISRGIFTDFPEYYRSAEDGGTSIDPIPRPPAMAQAYKEVCTILKKGSVRSISDAGFRGPWITAEALPLYEKGYWLRSGKHRFHPDPPGKASR